MRNPSGDRQLVEQWIREQHARAIERAKAFAAIALGLGLGAGCGLGASGNWMAAAIAGGCLIVAGIALAMQKGNE